MRRYYSATDKATVTVTQAVLQRDRQAHVTQSQIQTRGGT